MQSSPAIVTRKNRRKKLAGIAVIFFFLLPCFFCCSGLNFPMILPQSSLSTFLKGEVGVTLPASAKVLQGSRQAMRDPEYFYSLEMSPSDLAIFKSSILSAVKTKGLVLEPETRQFYIGPPPPKWYTPQIFTDLEILGFPIPDSSGAMTKGVRFFFSPSTGKAFVLIYTF